MARKEKKFHYIYKIINIKNGRYYIGMHSTDNLNDGYMGGGKRIRNSIRKHGLELHGKEILEYVDTRYILGEREREIVNDDLLNDPLCMNLCRGGHYNDRGWTSEDREKAKNTIINLSKDPQWSLTHSKKISDSLKGKKMDSFRNKKHTDAAKKSIGEKISANQKGEKNSQYGKCWVYNDSEMINIKIHKDQIDNYTEKGWELGLKMEYFKK